MKEESSTSGPVLFCAFTMCICIYWPVYLTFEYLLKRYQPEFYRRLERESRATKLAPVIMMFTRILFGVGITFPSCVYAAYTTPAGLGQPLNVPGQICMATQALVWAVEIPIVMEYKMELAIHHIICLMVLANTALSPTIHQAKPIYMYFASQLGDIGPGCVLITKMSGRKPHNSWLMFCVSFTSTMWLTFGKVGTTFTSLAMALENPYRIGDWVWGFCLLFFSVYTLFHAYKNLKWLGIFKSNESNPYRSIFLKRFDIPAGHACMGAGLAMSLISTTLVYCLYNKRVVERSELWEIGLQGLEAACAGMTGAVIAAYSLGQFSPTELPRGGLYLQVGIICAGAWIARMFSPTEGIHKEILFAAIGCSVPLLQVLMNIGGYYGVAERYKMISRRHVLIQTEGAKWEELLMRPTIAGKDGYPEARTATMEDSVSTESSSDDGRARKKFPKTVCPSLALSTTMSRAHLGVACSNLAIFSLSIASLSFDLLSLQDIAKLAIFGTVITQLTNCPGMIYHALLDSRRTVLVYTLLTSFATVIELAWTAYAMAVVWTDDDWSRIRLKLAGLALTAAIAEWINYLFAPKRSGETEVGEGKKLGQVPKRRGLVSPTNVTILLVIITQGFMVREVLRNPDYSSVEDTPQGWKNFRLAVGCPYMWVSAAFLAALPSLGFNALHFGEASQH